MTRFTWLLFLGAMSLSISVATADDQPKDKPSVKVEFRRAEKEAAEGLTEATVPNSKEKIYLHKTAELTNQDIAEARTSTDEFGKPALEIIFTKEGAQKLKKLTGEHREKPVAILVEGKVISAPIVKAEISGGKVMISGMFAKEDLEKIVKGLKSK